MEIIHSIIFGSYNDKQSNTEENKYIETKNRDEYNDKERSLEELISEINNSIDEISMENAINSNNFLEVNTNILSGVLLKTVIKYLYETYENGDTYQKTEKE